MVVVTIVLTIAMLLVMAEEFHQFPQQLQKISSTLAHNRNTRTAFICILIIVMSLSSSVSLLKNYPQNNVEEQSTNSSYSSSRVYSQTNPTLLLQRDSFEVPEIEVKNMEQELTVNLTLSAKLNTGITLKNINCTGDCFKGFISKLNKLFNDTNIGSGSTSTDSILLGRRKKRSTADTYIDQIKSILSKKYPVPDSPKMAQCSSLVLDYTDQPKKRSVSMDNFYLRDNSDQADNSTVSICDTYCKHPEYIVFTWVLCMIALATALKLYYLVKLLLTLVMVAIYTILILLPYKPIFDDVKSLIADGLVIFLVLLQIIDIFYIFSVAPPLSAQMLILLGVFLIMVAYHARLVEVTSRLDFLWKQQAERELADMEETKQNNEQLLTNILPEHVATHYLSNDRNTEVLLIFYCY